MKDLPDTAVSLVCRHLAPREWAVARLVCTQWRDSVRMAVTGLSPQALSWPPGTDCLEGLLRRWPCTCAVEFHRCATSVTDHDLGGLGRALPSLSHLDLEGCWKVTDKGMIEAFGFLLRLRKLSLAGCEQLTDDSVAAMPGNLECLESLDLTGCRNLRDGALVDLARLPCLAHLKLGWCRRLTDTGLANLAPLGARLLSLDLSELRLVTDQGIAACAKQSPRLSSLSLSWCRGFTGRGLKGLAEAAGASLRDLDLGGCKSLTDHDAVSFAVFCTLETLSLVLCTTITDAALELLPTTLRSLSLTGCRCVSDWGEDALWVRRLVNLQQLEAPHPTL